MIRPHVGQDDTICAISTPMGLSGVGVVRVSGPAAIPMVAPLFKGRGAFTQFSTHTLHYGKVVDPREAHLPHEIDEALFLILKAPQSYTGEDTVEIQSHGNPLILQKILALLMGQGARVALPGEFTRRAFLSGRIDLSQAEAVMELIASQSDAHHQWALRQLSGALSDEIEGLRTRLLTLLAGVEAEIDFPEEGLAFGAAAERINQVTSVRKEVQRLLSGYESGRRIRDGWTAVIVGRPNVGKSSLFNRLLGEERAIVTPYPGTTRDPLREWMRLSDILIQWVDTAGDHETSDPIESEGVRRGRAAARTADLTLLLLDASEPLQPEDRCLLDPLGDGSTPCAGQGKRIIILNKCDLPGHIDTASVVSRCSGDLLLPLSALTGAGIDDLKRAIREVVGGSAEKELPRVALLRHRNALSLVDAALERALIVARECADAEGGGAVEFLASDLRDALQFLGEITGETTSDEVLDQIFNQFCIGK